MADVAAMAVACLRARAWGAPSALVQLLHVLVLDGCLLLPWLGAAAGIQLRLGANMLDGLVAVEEGKGAPTGAHYNEAPDRVEDALLLVAALLAEAEALWGFAPDIEITLEANPSSVEAANFAALASAGINRVSLGVQSLDDAELRFLGRLHGATEALAALDFHATCSWRPFFLTERY